MNEKQSEATNVKQDDIPLIPLSHDNILSLYQQYTGLIKDELGFFFQSFQFYIGLLSAILGGTLTGLLTLDAGDIRGIALLVGPVLTILLSWVGYHNVQAFYRRFIEAWVTKLNLESSLHLTQNTPLEPGLAKPTYLNRKRGVVPEIEWKPLKEVFTEAQNRVWPAEEL